MKKNINYVLNLTLFISGFITTISSYVVWFILPHGMGSHGGDAHCSGGGVGFLGNLEAFQGLYRSNWIAIHNWSAVVLYVIAAVHIVLNWHWVEKTSEQFFNDFRNTAFKVQELFSSAAILFILAVFEGLSGLGLWLVLPRGVRDHSLMKQGQGRTLLGLQRNVWVDLHTWVAVIIIAMVVIHLVLNWSWVKGTTKKILRGLRRQIFEYRSSH